jgi:hypothetical protein
MHMDAGLPPARQARARHRHELRTLTYVTLDQANGGIVRNISHQGIGVQVVAAVRSRQQLPVRFELSHPRLRVETRGEVMWATSSGQCGIRFLDLSPGTTRQLNEWIFGNLLEGIALHCERTGSMFSDVRFAEAVRTETALRVSLRALPGSEDDGLMISASPVKVIELPLRPQPQPVHGLEAEAETDRLPASELDWLSQPLSGRSLIWTINTLVALAALLLFVLVFLSVTREPPRWPLAMIGGAALLVAVLYWGFFQLFGGSSPGARLARLVGSDLDRDAEASDDRFR